MKARIAMVALVGLLIVDVVLVVLAMRPPASADMSQTMPQTRTTAASVTPTAGGSPTTAPTTETPTGPGPLAVTIAGLDATTAWRATVGSCADGGASIEVTKDGGATWTAMKTPVGAIVRVQPLEKGRGFVIGAGTDCKPRQYSTTDTGATWSKPEPVDGGWARKLDTPTEILTPNQPNARACGDQVVLDLSRTSAEQAEALCADGSVKVTTDGGVSWGASGTAPGALAISNRIESGVLSTYAARVDPKCKGVQIFKVIKGRDAEPLGCVTTTVPERTGSVAISVASGTGWLLIGGDTYTSKDLKAWKKA